MPSPKPASFIANGIAANRQQHAQYTDDVTMFRAPKRYATAYDSSMGTYQRCTHLANASKAAPATILLPFGNFRRQISRAD